MIWILPLGFSSMVLSFYALYLGEGHESDDVDFVFCFIATWAWFLSASMILLDVLKFYQAGVYHA